MQVQCLITLDLPENKIKRCASGDYWEVDTETIYPVLKDFIFLRLQSESQTFPLLNLQIEEVLR